jgi:hypothetical protein
MTAIARSSIVKRPLRLVASVVVLLLAAFAANRVGRLPAPPTVTWPDGGAFMALTTIGDYVETFTVPASGVDELRFRIDPSRDRQVAVQIATDSGPVIRSVLVTPEMVSPEGYVTARFAHVDRPADGRLRLRLRARANVAVWKNRAGTLVLVASSHAPAAPAFIAALVSGRPGPLGTTAAFVAAVVLFVLAGAWLVIRAIADR